MVVAAKLYDLLLEHQYHVKTKHPEIRFSPADHSQLGSPSSWPLVSPSSSESALQSSEFQDCEQIDIKFESKIVIRHLACV